MIETILVVDEYDTHRVGLASVLRKATGADVIAARNGRIALDEIRQQRWDIVVLDLDLPDMTGLQLIDALARHGGAGGIILTSGHPAAWSRPRRPTRNRAASASWPRWKSR